MRINTLDHLVGRHENCIHGELPPEHCDWEVGKRSPELFPKMVNFFKRTEKFIINCEFKNSSQCNESLNNLISMLSAFAEMQNTSSNPKGETKIEEEEVDHEQAPASDEQEPTSKKHTPVPREPY